MDDAAPMGALHRLGQDANDLRGLARFLRDAGHLVGETAAVHVLQRKIGVAVLFADFVDLNDVRVLELGDRLGLRLEPRHGAGSRDAGRADHLDRHNAVQPRLPGLVDDPHAAAAELPEELVARDLRQGNREIELLSRGEIVLPQRGPQRSRSGGPGQGKRANGGQLRVDRAVVRRLLLLGCESRPAGGILLPWRVSTDGKFRGRRYRFRSEGARIRNGPGIRLAYLTFVQPGGSKRRWKGGGDPRGVHEPGIHRLGFGRGGSSVFRRVRPPLGLVRHSG